VDEEDERIGGGNGWRKWRRVEAMNREPG